MITYICFSLSDLFHSVWQTPGSSTSPQMTQFNSFLWLSNIHGVTKRWTWVSNWTIRNWIFYCIYVPQLLYQFLCHWTSRLFCVLAIVNSVAMNIEVHVCFLIPLIRFQHVPTYFYSIVWIGYSFYVRHFLQIPDHSCFSASL